jgi:rubredoxin
MSAFRCPGCDYVYDETKGDPREGFPAGTHWEDIPDEWCCPDCAVREKIDFTIDSNQTSQSETR